VQSKILLKKEKVWNIFKNQDSKGVGYLTYEQTLETFKEYIKDVNSMFFIFSLIWKNLEKF
jgi:sulfur relay (sulfurtransferase) DsrF/TusC family protein